MSHASLLDALDTGAIWSIARGLARNAATYTQHLMACDAERRSDLDGRGNLSEEALADFTEFFLRTCLDQVRFMEQLVQPVRLRDRVRLWTEEEVRAGTLPAKSGQVIEATLFRGELPRGDVPERWSIELVGLKFWIKLSAFKHTGIFPEQAGNWEWIKEKIKKQIANSKNSKVSVLNLFGYTGGATLAAAQAGAEVVHVDGSKAAIGWARDNADLSGLSDKPIRWILDDAVKFVQREIKRGHKYEGVIMDPPAFGHGPTGEVWKIEEDFVKLLALCHQVLSDQPLFFLVNGYASGYSALAYKNNLDELQKEYGGEVEVGELTITEANSGRLLPCGIFARWFSI